MSRSAVRGLSKWNWDGDAVVFNPIVPSSRPVVGGRRSYQIDVREFLVTERNAVVRQTLENDIREHLKGRRRGYEHFRARKQGCFDFRAQVIADWIGQKIKYTPKSGRDPWQFPDETIAIRGGDCEDRAFLIASLLLASGVSGYHVRVALGQVRTSSGRRFDHAWVMYKNEAGRWMLIEPLLLPSTSLHARPGRPTARRKSGAGKASKKARPFGEEAEYVPSFLFNDEHLWIVPSAKQPWSIERVIGRNWSKMKPTFAGEVHRSILHEAIGDIAPPDMLAFLEARFSPAVLGVVGPIVDDSDRGTYNPLDHFDNGLIDEGWTLVDQRLEAFYSNRANHESFAQAAHAIADFYAHSSYLHFASVSGPGGAEAPHAVPYSRADFHDHLHDEPFYGPTADGDPSSFDLTSDKFTMNSTLWKQGRQAAADAWEGKILTGRYAQVGDSKGDLINKLFIEGPAQIPKALVRAVMGSLPHHNEIAVDSPDRGAEHRLYDAESYAMQYRWRFNTAVVHIRSAFQG